MSVGRPGLGRQRGGGGADALILPSARDVIVFNSFSALTITREELSMTKKRLALVAAVVSLALTDASAFAQSGQFGGGLSLRVPLGADGGHTVVQPWAYGNSSTAGSGPGSFGSDSTGGIGGTGGLSLGAALSSGSTVGATVGTSIGGSVLGGRRP
jgi:hypothetical protein